MRNCSLERSYLSCTTTGLCAKLSKGKNTHTNTLTHTGTQTHSNKHIKNNFMALIVYNFLTHPLYYYYLSMPSNILQNENYNERHIFLAMDISPHFCLTFKVSHLQVVFISLFFIHNSEFSIFVNKELFISLVIFSHTHKNSWRQTQECKHCIAF